MAILVDEDTRLVVQGITGRDGAFHTQQMMEYGTAVVAGVTPGKGGQTFEGPGGKKVPIFNSMDQAVADTGANASVIFVPPAFASIWDTFAVNPFGGSHFAIASASRKAR